MQDFLPLHGGIFSGGGGGGGGGLVGYPALASPQNQPPPPPVKCPRCDSTNTKFCYYNNYNHSQPRHFCKACRRYWTMGGILRNVPVGGGCRKSKRSSSSKATSPAAYSDRNASRLWHPPSAAARSCIDDSTGTASPITVSSTSSPFSDSPLIAHQICAANPNPRLGQLPDSDPPLPETTIMETPSVDGLATIPSTLLGFIFPHPSPAREKAEAEPIGPGFADQTSQVDRRPLGVGNWLVPPDWAGPIEPTLYDLTGIVDPSSYWNQSHWSDSDSLFLPRLGD